MTVGQLDHGASGFERIARARRVVRVDHDERARLRRDQASHVVDVRHPPAVRVGAVEHGSSADFREHSRVQWIGRHWDQNVVARLGERGQRQFDPFRRARRDYHTVGRHRHSPPVTFGRDRLASRQDADRRRVAILATANRPVDRFNEVRRRFEAERNRVADIKVADAATEASTFRASVTILRIA